MTIVTSGPGDFTAKEKSILIFTTQTTNKNNATYCYLLLLLNTSFGNKDPLITNIFKLYKHTFCKPIVLSFLYSSNEQYLLQNVDVNKCPHYECSTMCYLWLYFEL